MAPTRRPQRRHAMAHGRRVRRPGLVRDGTCVCARPCGRAAVCKRTWPRPAPPLWQRTPERGPTVPYISCYSPARRAEIDTLSTKTIVRLRLRRSMAERTRARPISASTSLMTLRPAISPCEARRVARGGSPSEFGTPRRAGECRRASTPARRKQPLSCGRRVGVRVSGCAGPAVPSHHTEQLAPMHSGWFVAAFVGSRKM